MPPADLVISPELALVDPELASRARTADCIREWLPRTSPIPPRDEAAEEATTRHASRGRRVREAALVLSLGVNLLVVGTVFDDAVHPTAESDASTHVLTAALRLPPTATAERNVLSSLGQFPVLRERYVDPTTGLAARGVGARCDPHTAHVLEPWVMNCVVGRTVRGSRLETLLEYEVLPNGRFKISILG